MQGKSAAVNRPRGPDQSPDRFRLVRRHLPLVTPPMAMRFCILGSGSAGNSALLQTEGARVLVDAGFSARKLGQLLAGIGEDLARIDAIFLTHEHGDHAAAVEGLKKHPHIQVFANAATVHALQAGLGARSEEHTSELQSH